MRTEITPLLDQIIDAAKTRGMTQAELAEKAGISPVGLSKARHRGDLRASTLARLAAAVDLELTLTPARRRQRTAEAIRAGNFFRLKDEDD